MTRPRKPTGRAPKQRASKQETSKQATLVQVARLYYEENLSQQEIADRLEVSRSLIALFLQNAREAGIVRVQIVDPTNNCIELAAALKKKTGLKRITVIPNPRGSQILSLRAVAGAAAGYLAESLADGVTFGLAWGRTTTLVTDLLSPTRARQVDVLPLLGESGHSGLHSQMSQLVMQAAQRLEAKAHFLSLPMIVSSAALRDTLVKESGIRDIIAMWDRIDLACVGIGAVPPVPGMVVYIGEDALPRLINAGAVGDLCGIYYDRNGRIIQSGLEDRMIAASVEQLRAAGSLVAVACGDDKAVAVLGALRTGLVTTLFIDQSTAERILAELSAENTRKTP
jgi:DNA-binding transcriptional regulator LsrR (DeoR family)